MKSSTIIVTGAAGRLGSAVVDRLLADGVAVAGIDAVDFQRSGILALGNVDLADAAAARAAVIAVRAELGPIAGLANIAGGFRWETLTDGDPATWDMLFRLNLRTAMVMSQAVLEGRDASPLSIVNVGAAAALKAGAGMGAYAASKAGVARLTESLAEETKDLGVRVNAVLPSILDTPANRADMPDADFGRWVTPAALAEVIAFLLSDRAAAITGANIPVTGRV